MKPALRHRRANRHQSPLFFGTFNEASHPRTRVLRQGMEELGLTPRVMNRPLHISTAERVSMAQNPLLSVRLAYKIVMAWFRLGVERFRSDGSPAIVVGYMGHFDVHLARLLFPRSTIALDHLIGLGDTVRDRRITGLVPSVLGLVDRAALWQADLVLCDTEEQRQTLPPRILDKTLVVPVGAPTEWTDAAYQTGRRQQNDRLRVIFYGLFTPLQGTVSMANGIQIALEAGAPLDVTLVGTGQDYDAVRQILGGYESVQLIDWVESGDLPSLVASHDVSLGIFGETPKALRVVPNKVYQGLAAKTLVITSDTPCQRRMVGSSCLLVPPGDSEALASALTELAARRTSGHSLGSPTDASDWSPASVSQPLAEALGYTATSVPTRSDTPT